MQMIQVRENSRRTEECDCWREAIANGGAIVSLALKANGIGPHAGLDGVGPMMLRVHEHRAASILHVSDATFRDSVLEVGVDSTMGDALVDVPSVRKEQCFCEASVVAVVVRDLRSDFLSRE